VFVVCNIQAVGHKRATSLLDGSIPGRQTVTSLKARRSEHTDLPQTLSKAKDVEENVDTDSSVQVPSWGSGKRRQHGASKHSVGSRSREVKLMYVLYIPPLVLF